MRSTYIAFFLFAVASSAFQSVHGLLPQLLGPQAKCKDVVVCQGATLLAVDIDAGSSDPDGVIAVRLLSNYGPFLQVGIFDTVLTVKDDHGLLSVCTGKVDVRACTPAPVPAPVAPPPTNLIPKARCKDATVCLGGSISVADINNGSRDRDGRIVFMNLSLKGPFKTVGSQRVTLVVKDNEGAKGRCKATVNVKDCSPTTAPVPVTVEAPVSAPVIAVSQDPMSLCKNTTVCVGVAVKVADVDDGSYDPLGGLVTRAFDCGPFSSKGKQQCALTVTNAVGLTAKCTTTVDVVDCSTPAPVPPPVTVPTPT